MDARADRMPNHEQAQSKAVQIPQKEPSHPSFAEDVDTCVHDKGSLHEKITQHRFQTIGYIVFAFFNASDSMTGRLTMCTTRPVHGRN